jgi:hypothetical protein
MSMNDSVKTKKTTTKYENIEKLLSEASLICFSFFNHEYRYDVQEAVDELGLDEELIHELVEDYVAQIIKSVVQFEEILYGLASNKDTKSELDYTELKELAHKNLGVARNLRIKDSELLLKELMKKDDLEYLLKCVAVLRATAIVLKPKYAYKTITLMDVKSSF